MIFLRTKRAIEVKKKIFLVSQVLSFSIEKQTSTNVADTTFKAQPRKMVKHTHTICWMLPTNCLGVFDYFVRLALKE